MKKFFDKKESRVKLQMYLFETNPVTQANESVTQYSKLSMNRMRTEKIVASMTKTFLEREFAGQVQTALFYDNISGELIHKKVF